MTKSSEPKWIPIEPYTVKSLYNYRCPVCGGEFNYPSIEQLPGTAVIHKCPFCGFNLKGM